MPVSTFLLFTHSEHILWGAEITTTDETGVLPDTSLKSQLVMQQKELKLKQAHALLLLNSYKVFFNVSCVNVSLSELQDLRKWVS